MSGPDDWMEDDSLPNDEDDERDVSDDVDIVDASVYDDRGGHYVDRVPLARVERARTREVLAHANPAKAAQGSIITRSETCLRLALWLLRSRVVASDVTVSFIGKELTKFREPKFPVARFLGTLGCRREDEQRTGDWRTRYVVHGASFGVVLQSKPGGWHLTARLAGGGQLFAYAATASLKGSRGSAEHTAVRALAGLALSQQRVERSDVIVIAMPATERTRRIAAELRDAPRLTAAGLLVCTVDRMGQVYGLELERAEVGGAPGVGMQVSVL